MELNLKGRKRPALTIAFDEPVGSVRIPAPTKADFDRISAMLDADHDAKTYTIADLASDAHAAVYAILRTSPDFQHSKKELDRLLSIDEAMEIVHAWTRFIQAIYSQKNA